MKWMLPACLLVACTTTHGVHDAGIDGARPDAGGSHGDGGVDAAAGGCEPGPSEAELGRFRERVLRAWCERIDPCNDWRRWPDVESCMRYEAMARFAAASWSAVREGEVLDIEAADACLERLQCPYFGPWRFGWVTDGEPRPCAPFRRPCAGVPLARGERCARSADCSPDDHCDFTQCDTCQPRSPTGSPCRDGNAAHECMRGPAGEPALCIAATLAEQDLCRIGREAAPAGEGEPCGPIGLPAEILDLVPCAEGMLCLPRDRSQLLPLICVRPGRLGEPCTEAGCAIGSTCDFETSICSAPVVIEPVPSGAPCVGADDEDTCDGQWGTECVEGVCVASRGEGQPCDTQWLDWSLYRTSECDWPLRCAGSGTCERPLPLGAACGWPAEAHCEWCCDTEANVCASDTACWGEDPCL